MSTPAKGTQRRGRKADAKIYEDSRTNYELLLSQESYLFR
jgi:hypothetical protein